MGTQSTDSGEQGSIQCQALIGASRKRWQAPCVLMVAAETSSGAARLLCPSQMWPGSNQFWFSSETMCGCLWHSSGNKAFLSPGTDTLQPLGEAHDLEGAGGMDDISLRAGLRFAMTIPCFCQSRGITHLLSSPGHLKSGFWWMETSRPRAMAGLKSQV